MKSVKIINRSIIPKRLRANYKKIKPDFEEDDEGPELFTA